MLAGEVDVAMVRFVLERALSVNTVTASETPL